MNAGYKLLNCTDKGIGIFATKDFHTDEVVMTGTIEDANVDKNHSHASQMGEHRYALHGGNITKVNHSCSPNCGIKLNSAGAHDFVAMQTINIGEEITFDYAMRNYNVEFFPTICCCGAMNCRGSITGWKDLPASFKSDYHGFVAPYLLEMDRNKLNA